jgi:UDP-2,4-diacetamido-2,4,6-trideoxy-beta-L-altropyranose hydrolase|tara:strand:+ start:641 stop:1099 length:459 start_codon:yes stop_codon:yes gene_type:complete
MINTRVAIITDSKDIFEWRNDELTRKMSHTTDIVEWEGHSAWFASSLESKNRLLLLCENENGSKKIAVVRFDVSSTRALVSINLSPEMRGKGISKQCLSESIENFKNEFPQVVALDAEIKPENIASQRVFKSVGFVNVRDDVSTLYFEYLIC